MNRTTLVAMAAGALLGGTTVYTVTAQEYGDNAETDMEAMMQAYIEAGKPGPEHAELAKGVGSFVAQGTNYMPDGSTNEWEGTVERKMILDGRYVIEHYNTPEMMPGLDFEGWGLFGYDKTRGVYQGTWVDSMSTPIFIMEGHMKSGSNEMIMYGTRVDPLTKQKIKSKSITTINDDGSYVLDMYITSPEGDYKEMTIVHTPAES